MILYILFLILFYFILYTPPLRFVPVISIDQILVVLSIIYFFLKPNIIINSYRRFKFEYNLLIILCIYTVFRCILAGGYDISTLIGTANLIITIPLVLYFAKEIGITTSAKLVRAFLIVGTLASFISLLCVLFPNFNLSIKNILLEDDFLMEHTFRGFGFANRLTSSYGYIQGSILALGFIYSDKNKWFLIFSPIVFLATIVNARTGVVIALLVIMLSFFYNRKFYLFLLIGFIIYLLFSFFEEIIQILDLDNKTVLFILAFFDEGLSVYEGGDISESTLGTLLGEMWVMPDDFVQWIIGRGFFLFQNKEGIVGSDVGWVNQLNFGGIIYLMLILLLIFKMFRRLYALKLKSFAFFFISTFIIINTKSIFYPPSMDIAFLMSLYYSMVNSKLYLNK